MNEGAAAVAPRVTKHEKTKTSFYDSDRCADRLAGLGIMTRRVAPLPTPVAALADIALALCSAFCHILSHSFETNNTLKEPGSRAERH